MELQFQSNTCRCLKPAVREVRNTELTQELRLSDGMPDIGRVLSSWGQIILRSKEWQGDHIAVSGGIIVWILYAPEDGTPPRCVDAWVPFQLKWDLEETDREGTIRIRALLRFVDSRSVSARKMMIRAGVAAMGEALVPMQTQIYEPSQLPEDIQLLQNTYPVRLQMEAGEKTFLLDEDLQLPAGNAEPERLLAYTITPVLQEKKLAGDKVIMRGIGKLHVIYRCAEGRIHTVDLEVPVSQYAQLEDTYGNDAQADVAMGVTSLELQQNEGAQLRLKCGLVAQYLITDRYLAEVTEDAYSPQREIELHTEQFMLPTILEQRGETIPVQQSLPGIQADVVDVCFLPDFPRQSRTGDLVTLELPGQFQLLYYAPDGILQSATARWEGTMQLSAAPETQLACLVQLSGSVQPVAGAEDLSLNGQLKLQIHTYAQEAFPMVTAVEAGPISDPNPNRPSLILRRSEGESLWNMAKRCGSTVENIARVNRLDGQPDPKQMLLIPVS